MYSTKVGSWKPLEDYPIDSNRETEYLGKYAALYHDGAFYLFGGRTSENLNSQTIARLDTKTTKWSKGGCHKNFEKKPLETFFRFSLRNHTVQSPKSWNFKTWSFGSRFHFRRRKVFDYWRRQRWWWSS